MKRWVQQESRGSSSADFRLQSIRSDQLRDRYIYISIYRIECDLFIKARSSQSNNCQYRILNSSLGRFVSQWMRRRQPCDDLLSVNLFILAGASEPRKGKENESEFIVNIQSRDRGRNHGNYLAVGFHLFSSYAGLLLNNPAWSIKASAGSHTNAGQIKYSRCKPDWVGWSIGPRSQ